MPGPIFSDCACGNIYPVWNKAQWRPGSQFTLTITGAERYVLLATCFIFSNFPFPSRPSLSTNDSFYPCIEWGIPQGELRHEEVTDNKNKTYSAQIHVTGTHNEKERGLTVKNALTGQTHALWRHSATRQCQKNDVILVGHCMCRK
jgi:hypothetical protein